MDNTLERKRLKLHKTLFEINKNISKSYRGFFNQYFSNQEEFENLYEVCLSTFSGGFVDKTTQEPVTLEDFYKKYGCDLDWAKTSKFCGYTPPQKSKYDKYVSIEVEDDSPKPTTVKKSVEQD